MSPIRHPAATATHVRWRAASPTSRRSASPTLQPRTWDLQPRTFGAMVLPTWTPSTPHSTTSLQYAHMSAAEIVRTRGEQARSRHRAAAAAASAPDGEVASRRERYTRRSGGPAASTSSAAAAGAAGGAAAAAGSGGLSASASASSLATPLPTDDAADSGVAGGGGRDGFVSRGGGGAASRAPVGRRPGRPAAASGGVDSTALLPGVGDHDHTDDVTDGAAGGSGLASFLDASGDDAALAAAAGGAGTVDDAGTRRGASADILGSAAAFAGSLSSHGNLRVRSGSLDVPATDGGLDTSLGGVGDFSADLAGAAPLFGDDGDDDLDDARGAGGPPAAKRRRLGEPPADE